MTWTGLLLTGGESRRMGRDKAALEWEGEPWWRRQLGLLRRLGMAEVRVSARARPEWLPAGVEAILDEAPSHGPLSGLCVALEALQTTHVLALAVDMPAMEEGNLRRLMARARDGCGVMAKGGNGYEPLCAVYPREAATAARAALRSGNYALQIFARELERAGQLTVFELTEGELAFYQNINSPEDL